MKNFLDKFFSRSKNLDYISQNFKQITLTTPANKIFEAMIKEDKFLETAKCHGSFYGTSRNFVEEVRDAGKDIIFEIDWQGAKSIKAFILFAPCQSISKIISLPASLTSSTKFLEVP